MLESCIEALEESSRNLASIFYRISVVQNWMTSLDVRAPHHEDVDEDAGEEADDDEDERLLHGVAVSRNHLGPNSKTNFVSSYGLKNHLRMHFDIFCDI